MAAPITPADLIARLRVVMHASNDNELSDRIGVPLRSLMNYKNSDQAMGFKRTVELLELAGWLTVDDGTPPPAAKVRQARQVAARLAVQAEALAEILG